MSVTLELPDELEKRLKSKWGEAQLPRKILEALVVEAYRQQIISRGHVGDILGMNFWETEEFLKEHEAYLDFNAEDLEAERRALDRVLGEVK